MTKLMLPCPFCGGNARLISGAPGCHYVKCERCAAASDDCSADRAVQKWNIRKSVPVSRAIEIVLARCKMDGETARILKTQLASWRQMEGVK